MKPRHIIQLLSVGFGFSGIVALSAALPLSESGQGAPEADESNAATPADEVAPKAVPVEEFPEVTADMTAEWTPAPPGPEGPAPAIPEPDGVALAAAYPIPSAPESGVGEYGVPYALPMAASSAGLTPSELDANPAAAEDRSAPWVAAPGGFSAMPGSAYGDNSMSASSSGFNNVPPAFPLGGIGEDLLDGFSMSGTLSGTYDSNPSQGYAGPSTSGQSDYFLTLGGGLAYRSKASEWTYGATYNGSYSEYFEQLSLSGYNQSAGASVNYHGGPLTATLTGGINFGSGANRYYASVVDQITYNYHLGARYKLSAKTALTGDLSQNFNSSSGKSGGATNDQSSFDLGTSALWRYSPLTEFGPGIRYTYNTGSSQLDRSSIGPTITVNYILSKKVSLNSRVGMDFSQYSDGTTADPMVSALIGLNYQASRLWGMNLSFNRDARADPSVAGAFSEVSALRIGYHRKVRRATLSLGLGYETDTFQYPGSGSTSSRPDRDYLTVDSSFGMPIFANSTMASLFLRYSDQSGGSTNSWNSTQTGFSLSRSF